MQATSWKNSPLNTPAVFMFALTHVVVLTAVPWYGIAHGFSHAAWIWFAVLLCPLSWVAASVRLRHPIADDPVFRRAFGRWAAPRVRGARA